MQSNSFNINRLIPMDEEFKKSKKSLECMSIESFQSKNSSFTKYKASNGSHLNFSNRSTISMENDEGPYDLLKKLSGSETGKMDVEKASLRSSQMKGQPEMLKESDEGVDKAKLGSISLPFYQNQDLFPQQLKHECVCIKYKKYDYCPMVCDCYNAPEKCSKTKCCKVCFECKEQRLPEILQNISLQGKHNQKPMGLKKKDSNPDIGIYFGGGKKQPKKFREERCECRNSKCENKYCVCFTAGNKCTTKCLCENCRNSDFPAGSSSSQSQSKTQKPYLQEGGSNQSVSSNMEFYPPFNF